MSPGTENRDGLFWARIDILAQNFFFQKISRSKIICTHGHKILFWPKMGFWWNATMWHKILFRPKFGFWWYADIWHKINFRPKSGFWWYADMWHRINFRPKSYFWWYADMWHKINFRPKSGFDDMRTCGMKPWWLKFPST